MQAPAAEAQEGGNSSHPNNGHNNSSSGGDNSDAARSPPLGGDGAGPCQHHHGIPCPPPRSSVRVSLPSHAGHFHRILSMKAAAAAAQGGPEGPSRMERIRTLSRAYSSMHPHHGGGGGGLDGDGRGMIGCGWWMGGFDSR
jgi:hypothetical protein